MAGEIVLGYDGEPGSRAALQTAVAIAAAFKRPLVVAFGYAPAPIGGDVADLSKAVQDLGEKITAEAVAIAHGVDPSVTVQVELVNDRPAEAILRAGDQYDALAIVVGAAGRMLAVEGALKTQFEGTTLTITTPDLGPDAAPCRHAFVFKIAGAEALPEK